VDHRDFVGSKVGRKRFKEVQDAIDEEEADQGCVWVAVLLCFVPRIAEETEA
jgi:hypothetical protein